VKLVGFVLFFVGLFFVWVPAAQAQTPTPEPPTSTPVVTQIWPGPTRTPIGALGGCDPALTPIPEQYDLEYRFNCGHCFPVPTLSGSTSTPWPTVSIVTGTPGTAVPAGTGTPEVTVTVTPQSTYEIEELGTYPVDITGAGSVTIDTNAPTCDPIGYVLETSLQQVGAEGSGFYWSGWSSGHTNKWLHGAGSSITESGICFYESASPTGMCDEVTAFVWDDWGPYQLGYAELGQTGNWTFSVNQPVDSSYTVMANIKAIHPAGVCEIVEPEPTLEPGFCSNSASHIVEPVYSEILPLLYIRDGACLVVIPSIDAISPFIPESWTASEWSGVQVCMQYIGMGVVKLFGYDVYMLHYLTAGAAVAIIRRIMKG